MSRVFNAAPRAGEFKAIAVSSVTETREAVPLSSNMKLYQHTFGLAYDSNDRCDYSRSSLVFFIRNYVMIELNVYRLSTSRAMFKSLG